MRLAMAASLLMMATTMSNAQTSADIQAVSPALDRYTQQLRGGDLWKDGDLSPRDRSLVTLAALIARGQTIDLPRQLDAALANGVKPAEVSETITHLAFYAGWSNALSAVEATRSAFARHEVSADELPASDPELLPLNEDVEAKRKSSVADNFGTVAPRFLDYTTDVVFRELWQRPGLAPRDRSLVTVSALVATGQVAQITFHLNRAMDNGLTQPQAAEVMTQLAFHVGWPNVFSALPVVKAVFAGRPS